MIKEEEQHKSVKKKNWTEFQVEHLCKPDLFNTLPNKKLLERVLIVERKLEKNFYD